MYRRHGKRYCAITSHDSCKRCRFYEPSASATYEIAFDMVTKGRKQTDAFLSNTKELLSISEQLKRAGLNYIPTKINNSILDMERNK